jgi:hypothetical protein
VKARAQKLSPWNLLRNLLYLGAASCACALGDNHWKKKPMMNSVIHPVTGKEMQYKDLIKDPIFGPLFEIGLRNELGRICQGICDVAGTNTDFFIDLNNIPKTVKLLMANLFLSSNPTKLKSTG